MVKIKGKLLIVAGVFTAIVLLLASCEPSEEQPAAEQPTTEQLTTGQPTTEQPATGGPRGEITVALVSSSMRPMCDITTGTSVSAANVMKLLYDTLVNIDDKALIEPALAESWKIADDWSKVDFTLRQGVKWHNGDPFTAKDVKFTVDKIREPTSFFTYRADWQMFVKEVKVIDDYHVSFILNMPFPAIFDRMNDLLGIVPKDYYEKMGAAEFAAQPVGTGPFSIIDFKQDQFLNAKAVVNHYRQTPYLEKVHLVYVPEPTTRIAMLKTGEADITSVDPTQFTAVKDDPKLYVAWNNEDSISAWCFHDLMNPQTPSPFLDVRVRQAVHIAIDRKMICEKVFNGCYSPANQIYLSYNPGYDPDLPPIPYDPVRAKQLLAEAGYANGFETTLTYSIANRTYNEALAAYLADVGIKAKQVPMESGSYTFLRNRSTADPKGPMSLHGLTLHQQAHTTGIVHPGACVQSQMAGGSSQSAGVVNPKEKELIDKMVGYTIDDPQLTEMAHQLNKMALTDLYHSPTWIVNTPWTITSRVYPDLKHTPGKYVHLNFVDIRLK